MNRQALFCDGTGGYVIPPEPQKDQEIRLRFRTAKDDAEAVYLVIDGVYHGMQKVETRGHFDFYELQWELRTEKFTYFFEVHADDDRCCYNKLGPVDAAESMYSFNIVSGFSTPKWSKGAVMYQIFTDRFYN